MEDSHRTGLRLYEIAPGNERTIDIDTSENLPITIGRGKSSTIHIGELGQSVYVGHPDIEKKATGETVAISDFISRTQATIYRDSQGRLRIRGGNGKGAAHPLREGNNGKPITRSWLLGPGAFIWLTPSAGGYKCWLEWPKESAVYDAPTLGFSQWLADNLYEEIEDHQKAIRYQEQSIAALQRSIAELNNQSTEVNAQQNRLIRRLTRAVVLISLVVGIGGLISLGVDAELISELASVAGLIAGGMGGLFAWQVKQGS